MSRRHKVDQTGSFEIGGEGCSSFESLVALGLCGEDVSMYDLRFSAPPGLPPSPTYVSSETYDVPVLAPSDSTPSADSSISSNWADFPGGGQMVLRV